MSATETPVNSVAVTYPLGSQINSVANKMPLSSPKNEAEIINDDGIGSMGSSENSSDFGLNLKDTLQGLQSLNGQSQLSDDRMIDVKKLPGFRSTKHNLDSKNCSNENHEDGDIVILDDLDKISTNNGPKHDRNLKNDGSFNTSSNSQVVNLLDNSKTSPFAINDKVRDSFRDIMAKIQVNTPSLGKLLSKTKYIDCKDPNCKNLAEKNRLESEQLQQNGISGKSSGNLFENFQDARINTDIAQNKDENGQNSEDIEEITPPVKPAPEVIELDDSLEDEEVIHTEGKSSSNKEQGKEVSSESAVSNDCEEKETKSSNYTELEQSEGESWLGLSQGQEKENGAKVETTDSLEEVVSLDEEQTIEDDKQDCDISKKVQSSDNDKMEVDSDKDTKQLLDEELKNSEKELLELDPNEKVDDGKKCLDVEDAEMKDEEEEEDIKEDEEDKLLASDSETSEVNDCDDKDNKDCKMDVEAEEGESKESLLTEDVKESDDNKSSLNEIKFENSVKNEAQETDVNVVKKENMKDLNNVKEEKCSVNDNLNKTDSNDSCDRKRPADTDESLTSSEPKRSRLDFVIGRLGSQIGIKPESLPLEDDISDTEDSTRPDSEESSKSDDTSSSVSETEETEETEEEKSPRKKKKKKPIRLTRKELENLVKSKIMSYLKSERPGIIQELQTKVEELQEANEKWKQKAKDLEKQMLDLTVLQQKHEKRKAKTAALRQISTKCVAVQVDENKANMMSKLGQQSTTPQKQNIKITPQKTTVSLTLPSTQLKSLVSPSTAITQQRTNTAPTLSTVPPKLTPMTITQVTNNSSGPRLIPTATQAQTTIPVTVPSGSPVLQTSRSVFPTNQTVKSLLDCTRQTGGTAPKFVAQPPSTNFIMVSTSQPLVSTSSGNSQTILSKANSSIAQAIAVATSNQQIAQGTAAGTVKVIDLTGEEENAAKKSLLAQNSTVPILQTAIRPSMFTQQVVRPVVPGQPGLPPNQGILLSTAAGTQIVRSGAPQAYQLVFNPTSPAIRPGSLLTVVSAPNNSTTGIRPASNYIPTAVPTSVTTVPPPQLKTGQLVTTTPVTPVPKTVETIIKTTTVVPPVRPPPPLQSAPLTKTDDSKKAASEQSQHPAELPPSPIYHIKPHEKPLPPQPTLKISRVSQGIVLSWNMTLNPGSHSEIASYQLFAYQEGTAPPNTSLWKKVGDVKALPLPMACTLTQFQEGNHYHFAVRPVDVSGRVGPFSRPSSIHLTKKE